MAKAPRLSLALGRLGAAVAPPTSVRPAIQAQATRQRLMPQMGSRAWGSFDDELVGQLLFCPIDAESRCKTANHIPDRKVIMMAAAITSAATYGNQSVCVLQLGVRGGDCTGRVRHHTSPSAVAGRPRECRLWLESVGKRRSRRYCESRSGRDCFPRRIFPDFNKRLRGGGCGPSTRDH